MSVLSDTQFGLSLLNKTPPDESIVISPISISLSLAAIHAGAKGETKEEIRRALARGASDDDLFNFYKLTNASLSKQCLLNIVKNGKRDVQLNIGNRVYLKNASNVEEDYQNKVRRHLSTEVEHLRFDDVGASAKTVNSFLQKTTDGNSRNSISSRIFSTPDMKGLLVSTIYFEGKWKDQFQTVDFHRDFHVKEEITKKVRFMSQCDVQRLYFSTEQMEVLTLPYKDKKYTFTIILPRENIDFDTVRAGLTAERLQHLFKSVKETRMDILLPKFKMEVDTDAIPHLKALGINGVFSEDADLEGISSNIWISNVIHKAIIEINENGTGNVKANGNKGEAKRTVNSNSDEIVKFDANRPFLFFLCRKDKVVFSGQFFGGEQVDLYEPVGIQAVPPVSSEISGVSDVQFGLSFLKQMAKDESIVFSPMSIGFALSLVFVGATGKVKEEIRNALLGDVSDDQLLDYFKSVYAYLRENSEVFMRIANRVFVRNGFEIMNSYKETIAKNFAAEAVNLDFDDSEGSATHINKFIEQITEGMISDCVGPDAFLGDMNVLLTNVMYFEAPWRHVFAGYDEDWTFTFHVNEKVTKKIQCLGDEMYEKYGETNEVKVLTISYKDEKYTFSMILPREKFGLAAFRKNLTSEKLKTLLKNVKKSSIGVYFPKFKFETDVDATGILKSIGVGGMFSKDANLEGICPNVWIGSVYQKAIIDVNENGTRAAAATVSRGCGSLGPEFSFTADHPFLFFICREDKILFSGQYCG